VSSGVGLALAALVGVAACALVVGIFLGARLVRPAVADREHGSHAQESKLLVKAPCCCDSPARAGNRHQIAGGRQALHQVHGRYQAVQAKAQEGRTVAVSPYPRDALLFSVIAQTYLTKSGSFEGR